MNFLKRKTSSEKIPSIWTRDYTIMTLGSLVSCMGNATVSFVLGILVLEYSESVFLYGLYRTVYYASRVLIPLLAGTAIARVSKQKIIYVLDFAATAIYLFIAFSLRSGSLSYAWILCIALILGVFDCTYTVAFGSLYPSLIAPSQLHKAYSVYSMLSTCSGIAVPIAALLCTYVDYSVIFLMAAGFYFIAAVFETIPKLSEAGVTITSEKFSWKSSIQSFRDGMSYLKGQKAILLLTIIKAVHFFTLGMDSTLLLPYCRARWTKNSYLWYVLASSGTSSGYFMGGLLNSRVEVPRKKRMAFSVGVYLLIFICGGIRYFLPVALMVIVGYIYGISNSTEHTLRAVSIQRTIDPEQRSHYTGTSESLFNLGRALAGLFAGALAEILPIPCLNMISYGFCALVCFGILSTNWKPIKALYETTPDTAEVENNET